MIRHAKIEGRGHESLEAVRRFLPSNYEADSDGGSIFIHGEDSAGWTLDGYVIPRLASGLWFAREIDSQGNPRECTDCGVPNPLTATHYNTCPR